MKRFVLLFSIAFGLILTSSLYASGDDKNAKDELQRKSELDEPTNPYFGPEATSYPAPFNKRSGNPIVNARTAPAVSTGYYFMDSDDAIGEPWHPEPLIIDTNYEEANWRRIIKGPWLWDNSTAKTDLGEDGRPREGYRYFHNPSNANDSTDDAFAGPIPIGFAFYFNGVRYDSFYVSTNGVITLTNRRYIYDQQGNRKITEGDCYDRMSMDWFARSGSRSGTGTEAEDGTADNYGYLQSLPVLTSKGMSLNSGGNGRAAIIAPFWADGMISQWNKDAEEPEDFGKVFYYKNSAGNQLVIYYINYQIKGSLTYMWPNTNSYTAGANMRLAEDGYIGANAQVTLDRVDSSVTINYEMFKGRKTNGLYRNDSRDMFRWNTRAGVRGYARHMNWNSKKWNTATNAWGAPESSNPALLPWNNEYAQWTTCWDRYRLRQEDYPNDHQAVKYKQWKNTLRVIDIQYRVRPRVKIDGEYSDEFTEEVTTTQAQNYELLAGHNQIGQIQPVVLVQNLTNDIQGPLGVNFQSQDFEFKVRMRIDNVALERPIYNKAVKVDSLNIATRSAELPDSKVIYSNVKYQSQNYIADNDALYDDDDHLLPHRIEGTEYPVKGIPPYGFVQVYFPPFEPNENFPEQIGRMKATLMCEPRNPYNGGSYKDMWPFDDFYDVNFFSMKRIEVWESFTDDVTEWHQIRNEGAMPSVLKWVNIGCEVVPGEEVSRHPLPPRGRYQCQNEEVFPNTDIKSPTIKLFRPNSVPAGNRGGTQMRSFPIDITDKNGIVLSFSVQRTVNKPGTDWPRGWSDQNWAGCEHRVVKDNWYTQIYQPDYLRVEFALPSPDEVQGIANIDLYKVKETPGIQPAVDESQRWRYHQRRGGAAAEKNVSAYALFGGGGYQIGFLEDDKDSALANPSYTKREEHSLRADFFDDGIDYKFRRVTIPVPDTIVNAPAFGARNFRFRFIVDAKNNQLPNKMADDRDEFLIDNIRLLQSDNEDVDIELTSVDVQWPYTLAPASQCEKIPVSVELSNNTSVNSPAFWVKLRICDKGMYEQAEQIQNKEEREKAIEQTIVYCRLISIPLLRPGASIETPMPEWNASLNPPGEYRLIANAFIWGGDLEPMNDTTYYDYEINFGPVFAYDEITDKEHLEGGTNDVEQFVQVAGRGFSLYGYSMGGTTNMYDNLNWGAGESANKGSGQIAMKFRLNRPDTVFGYTVFYCPFNQQKEGVEMVLYEGDENSGTPTGTEVVGSRLESVRGWDDIENDYFWNRYVTYILPKEVILGQGVYWLSVSQLGETGIQIGGSAGRSGMRITNYYRHDLNPNDVVMNGSASMHLLIEKAFRVKNKQGNLMNDNMFAYQNTAGEGAWQEFMPTTGNPGYGHLNYVGTVQDGTVTYSRGTWIPMIRPYLGNRNYGEELTVVECPDVPVELVTFDGQVRESGIDLYWETASERNNYGFYVEKRDANERDAEWKSIGFVKGQGNSQSLNSYSYFDKEVSINETYQYRLRQVDNDGVQSCETFSEVKTLTFTSVATLSLSPNTPNPFFGLTKIAFSIPVRQNVTLEVVDMYGNVVRTLIANEELAAGSDDRSWDGTDNSGNIVANGTYLYRLIVGKDVLTGKMTLVR